MFPPVFSQGLFSDAPERENSSLRRFSNRDNPLSILHLSEPQSKI
jgi:hypothetical protein